MSSSWGDAMVAEAAQVREKGAADVAWENKEVKNQVSSKPPSPAGEADIGALIALGCSHARHDR
jgi:hypothetical protein